MRAIRQTWLLMTTGIVLLALLSACTKNTGDETATLPPELTSSPAPTRTPAPVDGLVLPPGPLPFSDGNGGTTAAFDVGFGFGIGPVFDGAALWFADGAYVVKASLDRASTESYLASRTEIIDMAVAGGALWTIDGGEGELRKLTLDGETVGRFSTSFGTELVAGENNVWVYVPDTRQVKRFDFLGNQTATLNIDATSGVFAVAEGYIWLWKGPTLTRYSLDGVPVSNWDVPFLEFADLRTPQIEVRSGIAWLSGHSVEEVVRVDTGTGDVKTISLAPYPGLRKPVSSVGLLALEDSVWIAYPGWEDPGEAPNIPGVHGPSFRRLQVFDPEGNPLAETTVDIPGETTTLLKVNNEVWLIAGAGPELTTFRRYLAEPDEEPGPERMKTG